MRDVLKGDLSLLILTALSESPAHGYALARRIEQCSENALKMREGSLYPALRQMEQNGQIAGEWQVQPSGPARKIYTLTAQGQKELSRQDQEWENYVTVIAATRRRLTYAHESA